MANTVFLSFLFFTGFVVIFTWFKVRNQNKSTQDGYFLGGRSLTGYLIASSLILTNLSAVSFVGMSTDAYNHNMAGMGYEVGSGITLIIVALFLVPRYLKQAITTVPDFLEDRYGYNVKLLVTVLFLLSYILNILPTTLYAGAVLINKIFDVNLLLGISNFHSFGFDPAGANYAKEVDFPALAIIGACIGLLGFFYAIYGGLKAVVIADTLNGIGLIVGGLMIPVFGLWMLGDGHGTHGFFAGWKTLVSAAPEKLQGVGSESNAVLPFSTMFTGMLLVNLYYWGTDQAIIQRALGAKNLAEGQKGVILAGGIKIITPLFLILPGVIAWHYFASNNIPVADPKDVYPMLVKEVLPGPLTGFFIAAMFGAILSTFNGVLNSSSTLFSLNVWNPLVAKGAMTEKQMIFAGRLFGVVVAVLSIVIAPFILFAQGGLFTYLQTVAAIFSMPVLVVVFLGYVTKRPTAQAAIVAIFVYVIGYVALEMLPKSLYGDAGTLRQIAELHFMHHAAIMFVISALVMLIIGTVKPRAIPYTMTVNDKVDVKPWMFRFEAAAVVLYMVLGAYVVFSDYGLVTGSSSFILLYFIGAIALVAGVVFNVKRRKRALLS